MQYLWPLTWNKQLAYSSRSLAWIRRKFHLPESRGCRMAAPVKGRCSGFPARHGRTLNGWFVSWKIPSINGWWYGVPPFQETAILQDHHKATAMALYPAELVVGGKCLGQIPSVTHCIEMAVSEHVAPPMFQWKASNRNQYKSLSIVVASNGIVWE